MKSLAGRVALLVTLAAAAVFAVVGTVLIAEVGRRERATFDRELRATAERMVARRRAGGRTAQLDRLAGDASVRLLTRGRETYDNRRAPGCRSRKQRPADRDAARGRLVVAR